MNTSKPGAKSATQEARTESGAKDLDTAYQVHTLVRTVHARLASTYPWVASPLNPVAGCPAPWWPTTTRMWSYSRGGGGLW